jgi:hypothetical protein
MIHVQVSRHPCQCGAAPTTASIPVTLGLTPAEYGDHNIRIDAGQVERDAVATLACKRCEL